MVDLIRSYMDLPPAPTEEEYFNAVVVWMLDHGIDEGQ